MAAGLLSGLLPNMMVGADQAIAPVQQVLDGNAAKAKEAEVVSESKSHHHHHSHDKCKPKSRRELEREKRYQRQYKMEEMIRKLILILLLFLLLFIVITGLFALGHHARWQASLLPDKSETPAAAAP